MEPRYCKEEQPKKEICDTFGLERSMVEVGFGDLKINVLVDSGSSHKLSINERHETFEKCATSLIEFSGMARVSIGYFPINIFINNEQYENVNFYVLPNELMRFSMLFGTNDG